jgi:release factor glutamine methyltransferase
VATWRELRERAERCLRDSGLSAFAASAAPAREARWIVERASGYEGVELVTSEHEIAPDVAAGHVDDMVRRRLAGEPLQYVLGRWQFLGHDLLVDVRVLVPRPETEVVAQVAIEEAVRAGARRGHHDAWNVTAAAFAVADLGTGSGAIALALASELPDAEVWATDVSDDALAVARANFAGAGSVATRVRVAAGSWFGALPEHLRGSLRLVVSNPPYVATDEVETLPSEVVDWEPRGALVSGPRGVEALEHIVDEARAWLDPDTGVLVCELAPHQAVAMTVYARAAGYSGVTIRTDLAGRNRVLVARLVG